MAAIYYRYSPAVWFLTILALASPFSVAQVKPKPQNIPPMQLPPSVPRPAAKKRPPRDPTISETRKEFRKRYSGLIQALNEFSEAYDKSSGEVMPLDKAKAVKKAWRDLQKIEPAFK